MCGIVGGVTLKNDVLEFLLNGLSTLEYRGYDSAGIAVQADGLLLRERKVGRVQALSDACESLKSRALSCGIGHTRWATHGVPSERNAHPHVSISNDHDVAVVHNGIIENHDELRTLLISRGYRFQSETDTEVVAHLVHWHLKQGVGLIDAVRLTRTHLRGLYAIAVMSATLPDVLVATRHGAPLIVGASSEGHFLASDVSALLSRTRQIAYLEDGDLAIIRHDRVEFEDVFGAPAMRQFVTSNLSAESVELGGFTHYMQKEIFEQPQALTDTVQEAVSDEPFVGNIFEGKSDPRLSGVRQVLMLACGTSYHAACVAKHWVEQIAQVPCVVEVASEYHYRHPVVMPNTLVVTVSQSGETADTRAALAYIQNSKHKDTLLSVSVCNVPESALTRMSDLRLMTHAGPEIGVASTKAFTTQLSALYLLALTLWQAKTAADGAGSEIENKLAQKLNELKQIPRLVQSAMMLEEGVKQWAAQLAEADSAIFLGRGTLHAISLEGALKLKEVTYIHAEAYSAGELKHGPLALIDEKMPVVVSVAKNELLDKVKSNIEEVRARKGQLFVVCEPGCGIEAQEGVHVLTLPTPVPEDLSAIVQVVPLQLLSYHAALVRGTDVDKPRNLAKAVTVE